MANGITGNGSASASTEKVTFWLLGALLSVLLLIGGWIINNLSEGIHSLNLKVERLEGLSAERTERLRAVEQAALDRDRRLSDLESRRCP